MHQQYQDAMAIVRRFVKPNLFITMTANNNWPEVKAALKEGQVPQDRCDILNRVFHLNKNQLIKEIENGCFGNCEERVHSIEFQKRGAPHMHLLVWLEFFDKHQKTLMELYQVKFLISIVPFMNMLLLPTFMDHVVI